MPDNPEILPPAAILDPILTQLDRIEEKLDRLLSVGRPATILGASGAAFNHPQGSIEPTAHQTSL